MVLAVYALQLLDGVNPRQWTRVGCHGRNSSARRPARQLFAAAHAEVVTEVFLFREKLHNQDFCNSVKQSLSNQPIPSYRGRCGGGDAEWIFNRPHDARSVGLFWY